MSDKFLGVVLLVEDEPLVRLVVADILVDGGFRVVEAANATEALTVLEAGIEVDVLLSDVEMPPGPDGYSFARQVHAAWPTIEILLSSGREWPVAGDLPPGAAFLAKPVPNETMLRHVISACERATSARGQPRQKKAEPQLAGDADILPFPKRA